MTYDPRCYDLAATFLSDESAEINTEANRDELAQMIQTEIETTIEHLFKPRLADPSNSGAGT